MKKLLYFCTPKYENIQKYMHMKKVLLGLSIACMLCTALVFDGCNGVDPFDPTEYCYKLTYTPTKGSDRGKYIVDYVWMNGDDLLSHKNWISENYGVYPSHEKITGTSSKSQCMSYKNGQSSGGDDDPYIPSPTMNSDVWVSGSKYLEIYKNSSSFKYGQETGSAATSFTAYGTYSLFGNTYTLRFSSVDNENYSEMESWVKEARISPDGSQLEFLGLYFQKAQ